MGTTMSLFDGLLVSLVSIIVVFLVLIIIAFIVNLMKRMDFLKDDESDLKSENKKLRSDDVSPEVVVAITTALWAMGEIEDSDFDKIKISRKV